MPDKDHAARTPEGTAGDGSEPRKPEIWRRYGPVIEAWLVFTVSTAVMIQILIWARSFTDEILPRWVASSTAWVMAGLGAAGEARGTMVHSSIGTVEIIRECTAVYPTALYLGAVFAYRCTWRKKLLGVVGGIIAIQLVNLTRVVSLIYILNWRPESFHFMHMVVWQSLVVFLTAILWLVWSTEFVPSSKRNAG